MSNVQLIDAAGIIQWLVLRTLTILSIFSFFSASFLFFSSSFLFFSAIKSILFWQRSFSSITALFSGSTANAWLQQSRASSNLSKANNAFADL